MTIYIILFYILVFNAHLSLSSFDFDQHYEMKSRIALSIVPRPSGPNVITCVLSSGPLFLGNRIGDWASGVGP